MTNETSPISRLGAGDVDIILDGEKHVMVPSAKALYEMSRIAGGIFALQQRITQGDIDAITKTIAIGLDIDIDADLQERIFRTGVYDLWFPCSAYIGIISNGGKPLVAKPKDDAAPQGKASRSLNS